MVNAVNSAENNLTTALTIQLNLLNSKSTFLSDLDDLLEAQSHFVPRYSTRISRAQHVLSACGAQRLFWLAAFSGENSV